jgi:hypothetical protein
MLVVICDTIMPGMPGIRKKEEGRSVKGKFNLSPVETVAPSELFTPHP